MSNFGNDERPDKRGPVEHLKEAMEQQQADLDARLIELRMLNTAASLKRLHAQLVPKTFAPGTAVNWLPGLRNRSVYGPFVVLRQCEPLAMTPDLGTDATTSGFLDPIDTQVMLRTSDESVMTMWLDSRHLQEHVEKE